MKLHLDLFSGIGGFAIAAKWAGYETVLFVEKDDYCQKVLRKHWPNVPIIGDIRDVTEETLADAQYSRLNAAEVTQGAREGSHASTEGQKPSCEPQRLCGERGSVAGMEPTTTGFPTIDLLTGGFPCQPFSVAGKRGGASDDRYLWPEMLRVIALLKPRWVLAENVAGIINMALDDVLSDLEREGYEVGAVVLPAVSVNAPHRRDRVWIVAHSTRGEGDGRERGIVACAERRWEGCNAAADTGREDVADTGQFAGGTGLRQVAAVVDWHQLGDGGVAADAERPGLEGADATGYPCSGRCADESGPRRREADWWTVEPELGRVAHGIPRRVDRLRCLGNAIVPQVAYEIIRRMEVA